MTAHNKEPTKSGSCSVDTADVVFSTAGNKVDKTKKVNEATIAYSKSEATAADATAILAIVKTGYKSTLVAVYSKIASELTTIEIMDLSTGALSLASAAAGVAILSMAF